MTFAVLVRGYGEAEPPQWLAISGLLSKMQSKFNLKPSTGDHFMIAEHTTLLFLICLGIILPLVLLCCQTDPNGVIFEADVSLKSKTVPEEYGLCAATFNVLLEVCARTKDLTRGYEVIERMERAGVLPDEQSVEAVKNRRALRTHLKRTFNF